MQGIAFFISHAIIHLEVSNADLFSGFLNVASLLVGSFALWYQFPSNDKLSYFKALGVILMADFLFVLVCYDGILRDESRSVQDECQLLNICIL